MVLDDIVDKKQPSIGELRNYILEFVRGELDEVYINGTKIPLDDYVLVKVSDDKITISGYGLNGYWNLETLADKIIEEKGSGWYSMNEIEKKKYLSSLFHYEDDENE